jgi:hypothetical protein
MTKRFGWRRHYRLLLVLGTDFILTSIYNFVVPLGTDDADGTAHFRYAHWIATHGRLPVTLTE